MEKDYKDFVEKLIQALLAATGYEENRIGTSEDSKFVLK